MVGRGVGVIFYSVAFLILSISPLFSVIILFMIVSTIGENFTSPTTQTVVTGIAPANLRGTYIGAYSFYTSFGSFAGSILGLLMLSYLRGITASFWIIIASGTMFVAVMYLLLDRIRHRELANIKVQA